MAKMVLYLVMYVMYGMDQLRKWYMISKKILDDRIEKYIEKHKEDEQALREMRVILVKVPGKKIELELPKEEYEDVNILASSKEDIMGERERSEEEEKVVENSMEGYTEEERRLKKELDEKMRQRDEFLKKLKELYEKSTGIKKEEIKSIIEIS